MAVSSTLHTWDFDGVTNLAPPIGVDEAFALARPDLARDAEGRFVFGVDYEVRLSCPGVVGHEREHEGHGAAGKALPSERRVRDVGNVRLARRDLRGRQVAIDVGHVLFVPGIDREAPQRSLPEGVVAALQVGNLVGTLTLGRHRLPPLALPRQPKPIDLGVVDGTEVAVDVVWPLSPDLDYAIAVPEGRDGATEVALASDVSARRETGSLGDGERRQVLGVDEEGGGPPLATKGEVVQDELQRARGQATAAKGRAQLVADVHLVTFQPVVLGVVIVVGPPGDLVPGDHTESRVWARTPRAKEPSALFVPPRQQGRDIRVARGPQSDHAVAERRGV